MPSDLREVTAQDWGVELMGIKAQSPAWNVRLWCCQGDQLACFQHWKPHTLGPSSVLDEPAWSVTLVVPVYPNPVLPLSKYVGVCRRNLLNI